MINKYTQVLSQLRHNPATWLVTGCAGFIGSNLLQALLQAEQTVIGLDNFATGHKHNLQEVQNAVSAQQWQRFKFIEGDIRNLDTCMQVSQGVQYVLHQAALGSVPRSIKQPLVSHDVNVNGFLNMLMAARDSNVHSFVYAASSSTYGDHPALPKTEDQIGRPLSPYAVTKYVNELYASVFNLSYGVNSVGLRYFNVFGQRQDPEGAYAAVIPKWIAAMIRNHDLTINGDGETSRDFCFIDNVVQANILAAVAPLDGQNQVYNVACNNRTSLNSLFSMLAASLAENGITYSKQPVYGAFREGDVRHSQADISKADRLLGYMPTHAIEQGIQASMPWYINFLKQ